MHCAVPTLVGVLAVRVAMLPCLLASRNFLTVHNSTVVICRVPTRAKSRPMSEGETPLVASAPVKRVVHCRRYPLMVTV